MITVPFYGLVIVPDVTYYFQKEYFNEISSKTAETNEEIVFVMLKEDKKLAEVSEGDFYPVGAVGYVHEIDESGNVAVKVTERIEFDQIQIQDGEFTLEYSKREEILDEDEEAVKEQYQEIRSRLVKFVNRYQWGIVARNYIMHWDTLDEMVASMSRYLYLSNEEKYKILETNEHSKRHELMKNAIYELIEVANVSEEAKQKQTDNHEKLYREEAIKKQIEVLQKELDEMHPESLTDIRKFELAIADAGMNDTAKREAEKILNRMKQEGENSHEYGMLYDYLDFVTNLSWKKEDYTPIDLKKAEEILDKDHFGLKKPKERIIQQIAVMALKQKQSGSIILFVGPPGTGKTSIGKSVADALGREYVRVSLGGIRDEAEIRGHRRTYVGAMPGRIMEGIKRSGVSNPVMVLDEVDKLVKGFDGDPSSALLEVLDPEQNATFTDHYMNVPYDLSDVLFICTANSTDTIPEPLLNRMEVIEFQGYTESEKLQIAKKHLLPKALDSAGIKKANLKLSDKAYHKLIADYTMEAGVRGLKKRLDTLCRQAAVKLVRGESDKISVTDKNLKEYLDCKPIRHDKVSGKKNPGVVTGLAWTQAGGDILFIEALFTKGEGKVIITGQLGDVMKESVQIAVSLAKSKYPNLAEKFAENDLHIHVPAGAVPKDGPSAGITLTTAISSLVTGKPVNPKVAMTGEVSLQGNVMPIGGLPEKLMAAVRAGVTRVFIPEENVDDLEDVADEVKDKLEIIPVHTCEDVLKRLELL
ncbi:MAG: endopeptidase La [Lachnospiraceae bacterium]|nr:endopeptidase La [Lachnospiraceae bacterium]